VIIEIVNKVCGKVILLGVDQLQYGVWQGQRSPPPPGSIVLHGPRTPALD
jgi:hypothetical protein